MASVLKRSIIAAAYSAWLGLIVVVAEISALIISATAIHALWGAPFGVEYSWNGWLHTQTRNLALAVAAAIVLAALLGAVVSIVVSASVRHGRKEALTATIVSVVLFLFLGPVLMDGPLSQLRGWGWRAFALVVVMLLAIGLGRKLSSDHGARTPWDIADSWLLIVGLFLFGVGGMGPVLRQAGTAAAIGLVLAWALVCLALLISADRIVRRAGMSRLLRAAPPITAAALALASYLAMAGRPSAPKAGPNASGDNVILIVLDTVRADHLSAYGYERETTPFLDRLVKEDKGSALFTGAYSTAPWTLPSHASFFTGAYPGVHGCHHENLYLDDEHLTVAEIFRARGYATLGYSNNPLVGRMSNLDQGFELFVEGWRQERSCLWAAELIKTIIRERHPELFPQDAGAAQTRWTVQGWISDLAKSGGPFFLFINYMEAHPPLPIHAESFHFFGSEDEGGRRLASIWDDHVARAAGRARLSPEQVDTIVTLYDSEIRYLDDEIKKLFAALDELGLQRDTAIVVISDHGELFDDHGGLWGHERTLYQDLIHVPLIVFAPGQMKKGARIDEPVSLRELPAMMLSLSEGKGIDGLLEASAPADRAELGGLLAEVYRPLSMMAVCEKRFPGYEVGPLDRRQKALLDYPWKLVWDSEGENVLFNLADDPGEEAGRSGDADEEYGRLMRSVIEYNERHQAGEGAPYVPELDPATLEKLRALGYLP